MLVNITPIKSIDFKTLNKNLQKELSLLDFDISNSASLNLLSRVLEYKNYNTLKGLEETKISKLHKSKQQYFRIHFNNKECNQCKSKIDYQTMQFCPSCNNKIKKKCLCGNSKYKDSQFCHHCGHEEFEYLTDIENAVLYFYTHIKNIIKEDINISIHFDRTANDNLDIYFQAYNKKGIPVKFNYIYVSESIKFSNNANLFLEEQIDTKGFPADNKLKTLYSDNGKLYLNKKGNIQNFKIGFSLKKNIHIKNIDLFFNELNNRISSYIPR